MPLNPDFVGRTYKTAEPYHVGREKIREFAKAIGDTNPAYHDVEAARALGHPDLVAPPTFPIIVSLPAMSDMAGDPDLGMNYAFVVHGEQSFKYERPICAGDEFFVESTVTEITSRRSNEYLTLAQQIKSPSGELIATATNVTVSRGTAAPEEA